MERGTNPGKSATTELDDRNGKTQKFIVFILQVKKLGVDGDTDTGVRSDPSSPRGQHSPRVSGQQMEGGRGQRVRKVLEGTSWGYCFLLPGSAGKERIPMGS